MPRRLDRILTRMAIRKPKADHAALMGIFHFPGTFPAPLAYHGKTNLFSARTTPRSAKAFQIATALHSHPGG